MRAREAEERVSARDAELEAVGRISKALARAEGAVAAGRALLAEASAVLRVEFAGLALIGRGRRGGASA